ncbi:MAG: heat-inducible transcriptional repressor HrcA [Atribacterota bacterium]|nr:heat-inducible transcriptional repressor HrcA [Atribacterota bacterium]
MITNDRMKSILNAVVYSYITTAEPISSEVIVKDYGLNVSSATIRHDMLSLEKMGYLKKPHTSAGRIPTDKGYRFYVDNLMSKNIYDLNKSIKKEINENYKIKKEFNEIMRITSKLISKLTNNLGVVLAPNMASDTLRDIRFILLNNNRILITIITDSGLFYQKIMNITHDISEDNLDTIEKIIKKEFYGKSLEVVNDEMLEKIYQYYFKYRTMESIWKLIEDCLDFHDDEENIFLGNRCYIVKQPEFKEIERLNYLFDFIEEEKNLIQIIKKSFLSKQYDIVIGSEFGKESMQDCSVITRQYTIKGKPMGAISVLGPTRINYPKAISILDFIANRLSKILSE